METPEGKEKRRVREYLTELGAFHRWPVPVGYGQPHVDCYACLSGLWFSIEVKRPGEEPTPLQWKTLRETEAAGGMVAWGTADDIIAVIDLWLKRRAHGGPVHDVSHDPHATAQRSRDGLVVR